MELCSAVHVGSGFHLGVDLAFAFGFELGCDFGFGFCRTGQGINISANHIKGIRSALIFDEYTAEMSRRHNCANFFSIPEKYVDSEILEKIILTLKNSSFDGGRHMTRMKKTIDIDNQCI